MDLNYRSLVANVGTKTVGKFRGGLADCKDRHLWVIVWVAIEFG
jgi:hypothetical protein